MARPVVVTFLGTLAACGGGQKQPPTSNPPPPVVQPEPEPESPAPQPTDEGGDGAMVTPGAPEPPGDLTRFTRVLNPEHAEHGRIYKNTDGTCYVRLPFPEGEGPPVAFRPPPTEAVDCPPVLTDASWDACAHGTVTATPEADACMCTVFGNPPPPPRTISCPKHEG